MIIWRISCIFMPFQRRNKLFSEIYRFYKLHCSQFKSPAALFFLPFSLSTYNYNTIFLQLVLLSSSGFETILSSGPLRTSQTISGLTWRRKQWIILNSCVSITILWWIKSNFFRNVAHRLQNITDMKSFLDSVILTGIHKFYVIFFKILWVPGHLT